MITKKLHLNKEKQKELVSYLIFGFTTTLVNVLVFQGLVFCKVDYKIANLIAIILGKLYAYVTNKKFVFRSKCSTWAETVKEFVRFAYARGITGVLDYFGLILAVECLKLNPVLSKYTLQIIIIVMNYIFSKWLVFK